MKKIIKLMLVLVLSLGIIVSVPTSDVSAVTFNTNVSTSKVTKNASKGSLPTSTTSLAGGKTYYFNLQTTSNIKITSAALYITVVGANGSATRVYKKTSSSGIQYTYYTFDNNTNGKVKYYWKIDYKTSSSSKTKSTSTSTKTVTVTAKTTINSTYNSALYSFVKQSAYKHGASWPSSKYYAGNYGCAAYVAYLTKALYGTSDKTAGTSYSKATYIQAGDVVHVDGHWFYVYGRKGNTLYTCEGNYSSKVNISTSLYVISSDTVIYRVLTSKKVKLTMDKGYHFDLKKV